MAGRFLGRLRALFSDDGAATPVAERALFIHEDDWGSVELLPASMAHWCRAELNKIAMFADAHRAADNAGWTDIYLRPPAPTLVADLSIPLAPVLEALAAQLSPFDRVTAGSFSAPVPAVDARAFGPSPQVAVVVLSDDEGNMVRSIFLLLNDAGADSAAVIEALRGLPSPEKLIVVDWLGGEIIEL